MPKYSTMSTTCKLRHHFFSAISTSLSLVSSPAKRVYRSQRIRAEKGEMRPSSMPSSDVPNVWHTPVPYLFGGFGAVMILIAVALLVLACSHWRSARNGDSESPNALEKPVIVQLDTEPRVVVIMAGDNKPSFIAKPFSLVQEAQDMSVKPTSLHPEL